MTIPDLMTCDGVADVLADYLEGDAPEAVRSAVDAHAAGCATCRALIDDLGSIRSGAASLPHLAPSRDLWSGVAARIDAPVIPMSTRQAARRTWLRPAVAAAALVAVTAGVTHYLTRAAFTPAGSTQQVAAAPARQSPVPASQPNAEISSTYTEQPAATARPSAQLVRRPLDAGEPVLDSEISKLRRIMNERRSQLDPKTVAILEQSMTVIDSAIAQSRAALAKDPASGFLATQLNRSLEKKVELLRTATQLPAAD